MVKVMVFGTFDIFHLGHQNFLKQAKKYGRYLIVIVARDKTVREIKKKKPLNGEKKRLRIIKESGLADMVKLGSLLDKYEVIEKYRPGVICLGYDQESFISGLKDELKKLKLQETKIFRLKAYKPKIYKSSKLALKLGL